MLPPRRGIPGGGGPALGEYVGRYVNDGRIESGLLERSERLEARLPREPGEVDVPARWQRHRGRPNLRGELSEPLVAA